MASTTIRYAKLDANVLFVDANAAANNVDAASISRPPGHSIVPGAVIDSGPSDEDQFDRAVAFSAEQEEKELARFQVNSAFWRRAYRVMIIGLGSPRSEPWTWCLVVLSVAAQICSSWVLQSMFYYTGTGTGSIDPGMVRLDSRVCPHCIWFENTVIQYRSLRHFYFCFSDTSISHVRTV
jgi:hypothetical protein